MQREFNKQVDGFNAVYFEGNRYSDFVVIRVSGSGATKKQVLSSSQFLMDAGFSVLCLGMYLWDNENATVSEIQIDDVERAIAWIRMEKGNDVHIGMTGLSLGALYTLACASYIQGIEAIAVASPFDHVMEGYTGSFKPTNTSSFTYHGQALPYTKWSVLRQGLVRLLFGALRDRAYGLSRILRYAYDQNGYVDESRVHVERMNADVLLLASKNDDCWPADHTVDRIVQTLEQAQYPRVVEHHIYEKGCHNMGGNMTLDGKTGKKMKKLMKAWKDHPEECIECIEDSKKRIIDFFIAFCERNNIL